MDDITPDNSFCHNSRTTSFGFSGVPPGPVKAQVKPVTPPSVVPADPVSFTVWTVSGGHFLRCPGEPSAFAEPAEEKTEGGSCKTVNR